MVDAGMKDDSREDANRPCWKTGHLYGGGIAPERTGARVLTAGGTVALGRT